MAKIGRPRLTDDPDPSVAVTVRLPARQYDRVYDAAAKDRLTIAEWMRKHADPEAKEPS